MAQKRSCLRVETLFRIYLFICSIASGILFAIVWHRYRITLSKLDNIHTPMKSASLHSKRMFKNRLDNRLHQIDYDQWLQSQGLQILSYSPEELSYGQIKSKMDTEAQFLKNRTRVLCMVLSRSRSRSWAIRNTWSRHCNDVIFYGRITDRTIPIIHVDWFDDSLYSTKTFCQAFSHLLKHKKKFDWLLIVTDRTYAIVENLRHMVAPLNQSEAFYFGRPVHHYFLGVYNAFDSGIVLSWGAVKLLKKTGLFQNASACRTIDTSSSSQDNGPMVSSAQFDSFIGLQLARFGCIASDTYDTSKMNSGSRFHPFMPERHLNPDLISIFDPYWTANVLPIRSGFKCCSDKAITFTGFSTVTIYFLEYTLYHLTIFPENIPYKGLGNRQPSEDFYRVRSDLDNEPKNHYHHPIHTHHPMEEYNNNNEPDDIESSGGWFSNQRTRMNTHFKPKNIPKLRNVGN